MNKLYAIVRLIRPTQWAKNVFVFIPLFFSHQLTDVDKLCDALWTFVAFCLVASAIYCFNDLLDIEADKKHPKKSLRPLASGALSKSTAVVTMIVLLSIAALITICNSDQYLVPSILGIYVLLNIAYTIKLKQHSIVDVMIIAIGFVLRLAAGGASTAVELSHWIVLMTFLLALFLALAKRRDDVLIFEQSGVKARTNISRYNIQFLNGVLSIISAVTIVCYIMYTVSDEVTARYSNDYLYLTSIFVIAGILRYMQLTQVDQQSGSPTKILYGDRFIQLSIAGWVISFALIIYSL